MGKAALPIYAHFMLVTCLDDGNRQPREGGRGVSRKIAGTTQQQYLDDFAGEMQMAGRHESVAPVVAFAAEDGDAQRLWVTLAHELCHRRSRVLHQRERGHAEAFRGQAINFAHFVCGHDLHRLAACSRSLSLAESPMAIRQSPAWMTSSEAGLKCMPSCLF